MNTDLITLIHYALTAAEAVALAIIGGYWKFRKTKVESDTAEHLVAVEEFNKLVMEVQLRKTETAVLTERVSNLIHVLDKLDKKLDEWECR